MNIFATAALILAFFFGGIHEATASVKWGPCRAEDGSGQARCIWDARHMGNGEGHSLKIIGGGTDDAQYIRISHRKAHRLAGI